MGTALLEPRALRRHACDVRERRCALPRSEPWRRCNRGARDGGASRRRRTCTRIRIRIVACGRREAAPRGVGFGLGLAQGRDGQCAAVDTRQGAKPEPRPAGRRRLPRLRVLLASVPVGRQGRADARRAARERVPRVESRHGAARERGARGGSSGVCRQNYLFDVNKNVLKSNNFLATNKCFDIKTNVAVKQKISRQKQIVTSNTYCDVKNSF